MWRVSGSRPALREYEDADSINSVHASRQVDVARSPRSRRLAITALCLAVLCMVLIACLPPGADFVTLPLIPLPVSAAMASLVLMILTVLCLLAGSLGLYRYYNPLAILSDRSARTLLQLPAAQRKLSGIDGEWASPSARARHVKDGRRARRRVHKLFRSGLEPLPQTPSDRRRQAATALGLEEMDVSPASSLASHHGLRAAVVNPHYAQSSIDSIADAHLSASYAGLRRGNDDERSGQLSDTATLGNAQNNAMTLYGGGRANSNAWQQDVGNVSRYSACMPELAGMTGEATWRLQQEEVTTTTSKSSSSKGKRRTHLINAVTRRRRHSVSDDEEGSSTSRLLKELKQARGGMHGFVSHSNEYEQVLDENLGGGDDTTESPFRVLQGRSRIMDPALEEQKLGSMNYLYETAGISEEAKSGDGLTYAETLRVSNSLLVTLGIDDNIADWARNIRSWITSYVLKPVVHALVETNREFERLARKILREQGPVLSYHQRQILAKRHDSTVDFNAMVTFVSQKYSYEPAVPKRKRIMKYLHIRDDKDLSSTDGYVLERVQTLARGDYMRAFKWNGGGDYQGRPWQQLLPTDSQLVFNLFCRHLEENIPNFSRNYLVSLVADQSDTSGTTWGLDAFARGRSSQKSLKPSELAPVVIVREQKRPPYWMLWVDNGRTEWRCVPGRVNLFYTLALFLYALQVYADGRLGRSSLNSKAFASLADVIRI